MTPRAFYRRIVLRLFPRAFRERHGDEMEETFAAHRARAHGSFAIAAVWLRALGDAVAHGLRERWKAITDTDHSTGGEGMKSLLTDLRYATRALARRPVLTLSAVVTLALGIGANTAIFSLVNGLLFRPLPYDDPDRLVTVWSEHPERGWSGTDVGLADAWDWRNRSDAFEDLAVFDNDPVALTGGERPEVLAGVHTTWNLFDVLGVEPARGRGFTPADGNEAAPGVVLLDHGFWERRFAGDPEVVGREVVLDGERHTVVGVLAPGFRFIDDRADLFIPIRTDPTTAPRGSHGMESVARLRDGVDREAALIAVNEVARRLQVEHPDTNDGWSASIVPLRTEVIGDVALQASLVLSGAVGFLLLMACVNVANLLLARAGTRRSEMAVRTALGAGRGRLVRLLLTETVVLATVGGALGMALAELGRRAIVGALPEQMPAVFSFDLDIRVLGFALAATLACVVLAGVIPALRPAAPPDDLRSGRRVGGASRLSGALVGVQTALAVVLLVAGGILARSVVAMRTQDFGWDVERVLYLPITIPEHRYPTAEEIGALHPRLIESLGALPGVERVGAIQAAPFGGSNWVTSVAVTDAGGEVAERSARVGYVTPGYFEAMGLTVLAGRDITAADRPGAPPVALVNETFRDRFLGGRNPVGMTMAGTSGSEFTVVGVVEDHLERGVEEPVEPGLYRPLAQNLVGSVTLVLRTAGEPASLIEPAREAVWAIDPDLPIDGATTLESVVVARVGGFELIAQLMGAFAILSLVLGAVGIYGVAAHSVVQRWQEIGIRMAMGADRANVTRMIVVHGARRAGIGLLIGLALAVPVSGALQGLAVGVDTGDPVLFLVVAGTLGAVALLAAWVPARRASRLDPASTLTAE